MLTTSTSAMSTLDVESSQLCSSSSNQQLQFPESSTKTAAASDEQWICSECNEPGEEGDDRWIVCDNCAKQYHLQCSGIQYARNEYYSLNIEEMDFFAMIALSWENSCNSGINFCCCCELPNLLWYFICLFPISM